ncbi:MAG: DUF268 domain-containing protein [Planctomycetota bacterium]|jgi:hypothetical protein
MGKRNQDGNNPVKWDELSEDEQNKFTIDNSIKKLDWFIDNLTSSEENIFFSKKVIDCFIDKALRGEENYYGKTDTFLYDCLSRCSIRDKSVAVLGSQQPWYEAVCLAYGGIPTTIEYASSNTDDDRLSLMTVSEYNKNPIKFDMAFSISSFEHDGLGRYGDPIDADGDLKAMRNVRENVLKKDGLLFLSVPIGVDTIVWNAHRIYGKKRWPKLMEGFEMIYFSGFSDDFLERHTGKSCYQPVVVLKTVCEEQD